MPLTLDGTNGVSAVQAGAVESGDLPAGSVIQVVQTDLNSAQSTNSTSFVGTDLIASITPSSASSKILVNVTINGIHMAGGAALGSRSEHAVYRQICLGGYSLLKNITRNNAISNGTDGGDTWHTTSSLCYLDSPASVNQVDYRIYFRVQNTTSFTFFSEAPPEGRWTSTLILMEIAG